MPYDFKITNDAGFVRVEVTGARVAGRVSADALQVWKAVAEQCHSTGVYRVLAILRISGKVPAGAVNEVNQGLASIGWDRRFVLATVDLIDESRQGNLLTEMVSVNRGYAVRVFDNEPEALGWLCGETVVGRREQCAELNDPLIESHTAPKFAAPDPGALADWYEMHLGFRKRVFNNGEYAIVSRGEMTLHFWKCSDRTIAENTACYTELPNAEAIDQLHSELVKRSDGPGFSPGRIQAEPRDAPGHGMREFHVWDPAGNLIGFGASI